VGLGRVLPGGARLTQTAGKELAAAVPHADWVLCVAFSADGKSLASGDADNTARVWDVRTLLDRKPDR
jgi:WD40 repeat protein